jgi:hypothetical protein
VDCTPTGMSESDFKNDFVISPNPSSGNFEITVPYNDGTLSIYDAFGKKIFEKKYNSSESRIEFNSANLRIVPGIYFAKISFAENIFVKKFFCYE